MRPAVEEIRESMLSGLRGSGPRQVMTLAVQLCDYILELEAAQAPAEGPVIAGLRAGLTEAMNNPLREVDERSAFGEALNLLDELVAEHGATAEDLELGALAVNEQLRVTKALLTSLELRHRRLLDDVFENSEAWHQICGSREDYE